MTDAVTAAPDDHRPALGGFGVLARWVWVSPVAIFAGLGLKASVQESMSYGLLGAMVVLFALVGVAFIIDGRTVMSQTRDNLWLIGVGPVPRDKSSVWSRGRLVGATVVVVGGVAAAVLAWVTAQLMASLFPRAEDLVDDRYDIYAGHSTPYVWLVQLVENGLSEELVFRSPVLAAYLLLRASTLAHRRFAWMLCSRIGRLDNSVRPVPQRLRDVERGTRLRHGTCLRRRHSPHPHRVDRGHRPHHLQHLGSARQPYLIAPLCRVSGQRRNNSEGWAGTVEDDAHPPLTRCGSASVCRRSTRFSALRGPGADGPPLAATAAVAGAEPWPELLGAEPGEPVGGGRALRGAAVRADRERAMSVDNADRSHRGRRRPRRGDPRPGGDRTRNQDASDSAAHPLSWRHGHDVFLSSHCGSSVRTTRSPRRDYW